MMRHANINYPQQTIKAAFGGGLLPSASCAAFSPSPAPENAGCHAGRDPLGTCRAEPSQPPCGQAQDERFSAPYPGAGRDRFRYNEHIKILPPAVPEAVDPIPETPESLPATPA